MLEHLRQRVIEAISAVQSATLSTYGPAELQATLLPCEAVGLHLYMLIPTTSDHLLNLEHPASVVVTTPEWQLRGTAVIVRGEQWPPELALLRRPAAQWSQLAQIQPTQLHIRRYNGRGHGETIDV